MATVGNTLWRLQADAKQFHKTIADAKAGLKSLGKETQNTKGAFGGMKAAISGINIRSLTSGISQGITQAGAAIEELKRDNIGGALDYAGNGLADTLMAIPYPALQAAGALLKLSMVVGKEVHSAMQEGTKASRAFLANLKNTIQFIGYTREQLEMSELSLSGGTSGQRFQLEDLQKQRAEAEANVKMKQELIKAQADINKLIQDQILKNEELGKSEVDVAGLQLSRLGANKQQIEEIKALKEIEVEHDKAIKAEEEREKQRIDMKKEAKKAQEDFFAEGRKAVLAAQTDMEQYTATVSRLNELLEGGSITYAEFGKVVRDARSKLESSRGSSTVQAPEAIVRGSSAAANFLADFEAKSQTSKGIEEIVDQNKEMLDLEKEHLDISKRMLENIGRRQAIQEVTF